MNSAIATFQFENQPLRFVGTVDNPEWVAADVVAILYPQTDKRNRRNYLDKVPSEWKGHARLMTPGGEQEMTTLYEPGLYHLICRSDSPLAIPFQKWVFEEILPAIRKTSCYVASPVHPSLRAPSLDFRDLILQTDLTRAELRVLAVLDQNQGDRTSQSEPLMSEAAIAAQLDLDVRTVKRAMVRLQALGLLEVRRQVHYHLMPLV